jgi:hypothetical protein
VADEKFYNLETYLFDEVGHNFRNGSQLNAFDFFCIVIWKANRAKSRVAGRLLSHGAGFENLNDAVNELAQQIRTALEVRSRMKILIEDWGFRLPIASAILTVLYPNDFTVYDYRVCETLGGYGRIQFRTNFDTLWNGYVQYMRAVRETEGDGDLRAKDKRLWGRSFREQLERDVSKKFVGTSDDSEGGA